MARNGTHGEAALVVALAAGATKPEAAKRSGVAVRTVYRRLEDAEFRSAVRRERDALVQNALGRLTDASADAADVLRSIAVDGDAPAGARVAAARATLELGTRLRESVELSERIDAIEASLGAR